MSGRLTPAAATFTSICPGPGLGVANTLGLSTSGPPGMLISIAVMVSGGRAMLQLHAGFGLIANGTVARRAGLRQGRTHVRDARPFRRSVRRYRLGGTTTRDR